MHVLVTGGAGFIGSALTTALLAAGYRVTCVDNLSRGRAHNLPRHAALIEQDVLDEDIATLLAQQRPDAVVHLAAQIHVRQSDESPLGDAEQNIVGTLRLLLAAEAAKVKTLILASSGGAVYGNHAPRPTPESYAPCAPLSPYGASKLGAEQYCELFGRRTNMRTVTLRLGNVYGPKQSTKGESGVIALFIEALRAKRRLKLFGAGLQSRDYVFVDDAVRAFVLALQHEHARGIINIGTGTATSVRALMDELSGLLGPAAAPDILPERAFEIAHSCLDARRAAALLGWRAEVGLAEGLRRTIADHR